MTSPVWIIDGSLVARTILKITQRRTGLASTSYSAGNEALRATCGSCRAMRRGLCSSKGGCLTWMATT